MSHNHNKQTGWPIYQDITIIQGDQFQLLPLWLTVNTSTNTTLPKDLTDYTAEMEIRAIPGSPTIARYTTDNARILLPVEGGDQVEEWEDSGIFVFADSTKKWNIWIMIPATDTKSLPPGIYAYDLKLTPPGNPGGRFTFYKGTCCVEAEVTK